MLFQDRHDAGQQLAAKLEPYRHEKPFIIALPRGGVVVGYEVARALKAPLDIIVPRKLGVPSQPELGFGAIAPNGVRILNRDIIRLVGLTESEIENVAGQEVKEMERRLHLYRGDVPTPSLENRMVIIVDDGIATGITALAAIQSVRKLHPKKIILAVPVSSPETMDSLRTKVDSVVCVQTPYDFMSVGTWYRSFPQVTDAEVIQLLQFSKAEHAKTR